MKQYYKDKKEIKLTQKAEAELDKVDEILVKKKDIVFVIDLSGSMREHGKMKAAKNGALEVFDIAINNADQVAILGFHSELQYILPLTNKGQSSEIIRNKIQNIEETPYQTMFYDAVAEGIQIIMNTPTDRQKWVIALTDGFDNCSVKYHPENLTTFIKNLAQPINLILIGVGPELQQVANDFIKIVKSTPKGKYIPIYAAKNVAQQIEKAFQQVQQIMAFSEIEGFSPDEN
jgi:Mg-chelatase subunit ChlD